jgi:hypothetical protein
MSQQREIEGFAAILDCHFCEKLLLRTACFPIEHYHEEVKCLRKGVGGGSGPPEALCYHTYH